MKNIIVSLVVGVLVGIGGTVGVTALNNGDSTPNNLENNQLTASDHSTMSMADMNKELENLSGDYYDKAFIEMMMAHHEGAVDMAKLSKERAKHDEIKELSLEIIAAQDGEISEMKQWQADWGYADDEVNQQMHSNH